MPYGSWQTNPLIQHAQNSRSRAPDVTLREWHRIVGALHAAKFLAVHLMVGGIHQERKGHLERIVHFGMVDAQFEARPYPRDRRQDTKSEPGCVEIEIADRLDEFPTKADLLLGFAQRGVERGSIRRVDLAAGKRNPVSYTHLTLP